MSFKDMVSFIKTSYPGRKYLVPCLVGPAGIGKTAAVKQAASELGAGKVVTIIASQILPNEVSGITMPVVETKAMEIFDHYRLSSLEDGDVLFFDELLEADQLVLSACLTLIESRELMSGRKLPDCMIVAATNPTIKPNMLKENIRQRFVWRSFALDPEDCRQYIKKACGFDVGRSLVNKLSVTGDEYNILTPRSLTKMAQWISSAKDESEAREIASMIDSIWHYQLGTQLRKRYLEEINTPQAQVRRAIRASITEAGVTNDELGKLRPIMDDDEFFDDTSMEEIVELLSSLPEWAAISARLSSVEMREEEPDEINF